MIGDSPKLSRRETLAVVLRKPSRVILRKPERSEWRPRDRSPGEALHSREEKPWRESDPSVGRRFARPPLRMTAWVEPPLRLSG
jgi:hypothetical protein